MTLADILSMDGLHLVSTLVQDRILTMRLVSRKVMMALESNIFTNIHLHINDVGVDNLTSNLLKRWHGRVHLCCTRPWNTDSRWFKEVRKALFSGQLRPLSLLSLSVSGKDLHPLVKLLVGIRPAIQQLEIDYRGDGAELLAAAAPLASLGRALTMKISVEGKDRLMSSWLPCLLSSSIKIKTMSLRSCTNSQFLPSSLLSDSSPLFEIYVLSLLPSPHHLLASWKLQSLTNISIQVGCLVLLVTYPYLVEVNISSRVIECDGSAQQAATQLAPRALPITLVRCAGPHRPPAPLPVFKPFSRIRPGK